MQLPEVLILGTNDNATACALRLFRAGFKIILLGSNAIHNDLHHHRTFTRAVHLGIKTIDALTARTWSNAIEQNLVPLDATLDDFIRYVQLNREIPLVLSEDLKKGLRLSARFVVLADAELMSSGLLHLDEQAIVIALQNIASDTIHYRISTHPWFYGRVIYPFNHEELEGVPETNPEMPLILTAPQEGVFQTAKEIGQVVFEKEAIGFIDEVPLRSSVEGVLSGQLNSGIFVKAGQQVIEVSTKDRAEVVRIFPADAFAMAGGVLEAILYHLQQLG